MAPESGALRWFCIISLLILMTLIINWTCGMVAYRVFGWEYPGGVDGSLVAICIIVGLLVGLEAWFLLKPNIGDDEGA
jgi:hypothetical protein